MKHSELDIELVNIEDLTDINQSDLDDEMIGDSLLRIRIMDPIKKRRVVVYAFFRFVPTYDETGGRLELGIAYSVARYGNLDYIVEPLMKVLSEEINTYIDRKAEDFAQQTK